MTLKKRGPRPLVPKPRQAAIHCATVNLGANASSRTGKGVAPAYPTICIVSNPQDSVNDSNRVTQQSDIKALLANQPTDR